MKNLIYALAICLLMAGCEKYESGPVNQSAVGKRLLSESETVLKNNLAEAAKIMADVINDQKVISELRTLSDENRTFYSLSFKDLLDESKGVSSLFKNLRERFLNSCSSGESKGSWGDLANYLAKNDCYIYCPYPSSFYPKGNNSYTVASHPVDNDIENVGYRFDGRKMTEVKVNEDYADKHQVILIMPKDDDNDDIKGLEITGPPAGSKGDPVYEVKIGKVRCADFCGGLFEGELELKLTRGYPEMNLTTGLITSKFTTLIPVSYPRSYAKAAINDWTVHSEAGWYTVNIPWDTNWRIEKAQQCILVYEYDTVKESTASASVGYKKDETSLTSTISIKATYAGDFLGLIEWDRDWFLSTNTNPGPYDNVKDGWTIRKTCPELKLTTPLRIF